MTRHPELYQTITALTFYHSIIRKMHHIIFRKKKYHKLYSTTGDHSNHNLLHQSSS